MESTLNFISGSGCTSATNESYLIQPVTGCV